MSEQAMTSDTPAKKSPYSEGYDAQKTTYIDECPYPEGSPEYGSWHEGYSDADIAAELAREMSKKHPPGLAKRQQLYENDAVWAAFYRDGKNLRQICEQFGCGIYDLSPWLTAPLVNALAEASTTPRTDTTAQEGRG